MKKNQRQTTASPPFHGWYFTGICSVMMGLASALYGRGFSVYFLSLARDLKLSHTSTSLIFGLASLESGIQGPISGFCIDRWGPKIMMIIGVVLVGVGFLLLPLSNSYTVFLLIFIGLISVGENTGFHNASGAIVTRWFVRKRGTAFGVVSMGIAAGSSLLTPVVAFIVLNYGWRLAATISGVLVLALGVPLTSMLKNAPEDVGQAPDGDIGVNKLRSTRSSTTDFKVREAVRTRAYWLLAIGIALRISAINGVMVHIVPLMVWKGFGEGAGGVVIATGSMAAIGTRFVMGWMGDRWSKRKIVCVSMLVGMNSLILIWYLPGNLALIATFVVTLSVTDGAAGLTWAMLGDYFGASYYATLRGVMNTMTSLGTLSSPVIAGIIFDSTQSYSWALLLFAGVYGLAFTVFFSVRGPEKYIVSDRATG